MKRNNNILIIIMFSLTISSTSSAQQTSYWVSIINPIQHYSSQVFHSGINVVSQFSSSLFTTISSWSTNKILKVTLTGFTILIALVGIKKVHELMSYLFNQAGSIIANNLDSFSRTMILKATPKELQYYLDLISKNSHTKIPKIQEEMTDIIKTILEKYYSEYSTILTKTTNGLDKISQLINAVRNPSYIFTSKNDLKYHTIPQEYLGHNVANIPGLNWGNNGLRYYAVQIVENELIQNNFSDKKQLFITNKNKHAKNN